MNRNKLVREQLEASLQRLAPLRGINPPSKGWVRAIRDALGMTARQLAGRLGVSQQSVTRIENHELSGAVTVKTMRRVAEGLDCVFVCGFVPKSSLEATLRKQLSGLHPDALPGRPRRWHWRTRGSARGKQEGPVRNGGRDRRRVAFEPLERA